MSNGRLCPGAREKIPRTFAHSVGLFNKIVLSPHVWPCVRVFVHWGLSLEHHQRGTDYALRDVCRGPLLCPPSTYARVQNHFEFVEFGGDMCSNFTGEVQAGTGSSIWYQLILLFFSGWYQLLPRAM